MPDPRAKLEGECAEAAVRWPFRGFSRWRHSEAGDVVDITSRDRASEAENVMNLLGVNSGFAVADIGAGSGYYTGFRRSPDVVELLGKRTMFGG
jgi:hypothetical protein